MKKAILLVSYGVASKAAWEKSLNMLESEIRRQWPQWSVRQAFTGRRILEKCRAQGFDMPDERQALNELVRSEYERIIVLPTHLACGSEYERVIAAVKEIAPWCKIGLPLLENESLRQKVAESLYRETLSAEDQTVLYVGHGTQREDDRVYGLLEGELHRIGQQSAVVGSLNSREASLARVSMKKVILVPLLLTAGRHALRDVCGEDEKSVASLLRAGGAEVCSIEKGLMEYKSIRRIYLDQLEELVQSFIL